MIFIHVVHSGQHDLQDLLAPNASFGFHAHQVIRQGICCGA